MRHNLTPPPAIILNINPPHKVFIPIITPKEPFHNDSFLSKLAEIDGSLSKLKAVSTTINDPFNAEIPMHEQSDHAINEDDKETARVCQGQGFETHATLRAVTTGKQKTQFSQQQGTWKRFNNAGVPRSTNRIASIVDSMLPTKKFMRSSLIPMVYQAKNVWFLLRLILLLWQRLMLSPTHHNESLSLELLWA